MGKNRELHQLSKRPSAQQRSRGIRPIFFAMASSPPLFRWSAIVAALFSVGVAGAAAQKSSGPANGTLIVDGGGATREVVARFVALAGGPRARIVAFPTGASAIRFGDANTILDPDWARERPEWRAYETYLKQWLGVASVVILHTRDRNQADAAEFIAPLKTATGVYLASGNSGRYAAAYLGTRTQQELKALLERGGVIFGSSAGAIIQGSFLVRGRPDKPLLMAPGQTTGFGFLSNVAINPHLTSAKRDAELINVVDAHPELLGIGIDDEAALLVRQNGFEVIGSGQVAIYDNVRREGSWYYWLKPGDRFDLANWKPDGPGRLVDVGGHKLYLRCVGPADGSPVVLFESGGGGSSGDWSRIQQLLSERVRSCAYDRAGLGKSEPGPAPRTMRQEGFELDALLDAANVRGPLILVGQSLGAFLVRLYAERHSDAVAGVVLVDPTHEDDMLYSVAAGKWVRLRELATGREVPEPRRVGAPSTGYDPTQDFQPEEFAQLYQSRQARPQPLGQRPLIVLGAGKRPAPPGTSEEFAQQLRELRDRNVRDLARLSGNAKFILDPTSGHSIHTDNPQLGARAIEEVVAAVSSGGKLVP
jgi:cyanophycinase